MEISSTQDQANVPVTIFHLKGHLDGEQPLWNSAQEAYQAGARHFLLDLSQVALVSSAGMRVLHNIFMMLRQDQSGQDEQTVKMGIASGSYTSPHLKLLKPSEAVQRALRVAGFDMFLEIHQDYKKALASF